MGVGLHICGYTGFILQEMVDTGVTSIISIDTPTDLAEAVEITKDKAVLIGKVSIGLFFS